MELEKLLGDKVGFLPLMPIKGKEIAQSGYSKDKSHVLIVKKMLCYGSGQAHAETRRDVTFGDYGSPIFVRDGKKIGVGALHVAVGIAIFLSRGGVK